MPASNVASENSLANHPAGSWTALLKFSAPVTLIIVPGGIGICIVVPGGQ